MARSPDAIRGDLTWDNPPRAVVTFLSNNLNEDEQIVADVWGKYYDEKTAILATTQRVLVIMYEKGGVIGLRSGRGRETTFLYEQMAWDTVHSFRVDPLEKAVDVKPTGRPTCSVERIHHGSVDQLAEALQNRAPAGVQSGR